MKEYELVHEIQNLCRNNQMRDIFFDEVETDNPANYVCNYFAGKNAELTVDEQPGGAVTVYASVNGMTHKFVFTPV